MLKLELLEHLQPAFTEVLETMFFTSVLEVLDSGEMPAGIPAIFSRLNFHGVPSGEFEIAISQDAARILAAGFLGEDEQEFPDAKAGEVVCELANMLCGSFLSLIGSRSTFELSHPELVGIPMEAPIASAAFELPEGRLAVAIRFEEPR
jgi:chemotaxis protein CheY-P-specific phosphatase CheC